MFNLLCSMPIGTPIDLLGSMLSTYLEYIQADPRGGGVKGKMVIIIVTKKALPIHTHHLHANSSMHSGETVVLPPFAAVYAKWPLTEHCTNLGQPFYNSGAQS